MSDAPQPLPIQQVVVDERRLITVPWVLFFQTLGKKATAAGGAGPYTRVLLLKDLTTGTDIAEHQYIFLPGVNGKGRRIGAVLRKTISADLQVKFRNITAGAPIATVTIPSTTAVDSFLSFDISAMTFHDRDIIAADIVASDMSIDPHGICAITLEWRPA